MELVEGEFAIGEQGLKGLKVFLQNRVAFEEIEHELEDVDNFFFNLVEDPLVHFACGEDAGILKVDKVAGGLGLREFQNALQIADAHFAVGHDEMEDAQAGGIGTCQKNLCTQVDIEML